jgi:hypothetical protein
MLDIEKSREIERAATPGPWRWDIRSRDNSCKVLTDHSGGYYVMGFERWGMRGATPTFQAYKKYEGPVDERGGLGMKKATELSKSIPGKEHHEGWDDYIDHPDALLILYARNTLPALLDELERKDAIIAERDAEIERLEGADLALDAALRRCAALENAIKQCDDSDAACCQTCVSSPETVGCDKYEQCFEGSEWEFDESRFSSAEAGEKG